MSGGFEDPRLSREARKRGRYQCETDGDCQAPLGCLHSDHVGGGSMCVRFCSTDGDCPGDTRCRTRPSEPNLRQCVGRSRHFLPDGGIEEYGP